MNREEIRKVSINHCVGDDELEEFRRLCDEADPGDWHVSDGRVVRYGGAPLAKVEESLRLMARAVTTISRLLMGIKVLEDAPRMVWAKLEMERRGRFQERDQYEADIARTRRSETGPDHEIDQIAEAVELGVLDATGLRRALRDWAAGREVQRGIYSIDIVRARQDAEEREETRRKVEAEWRRGREETRVLLDELKLKKKERGELEKRIRARMAASSKT